MKRRFFLMTLVLTALVSQLFFSSCCNLVSDNLTTCPQALRVRFYNMTPCDASQPHPERIAEHLNHVSFALLDANNNLVQQYNINDIKTDSEGYRYIQVPRPKIGNYRLVAWGTEDKSDYAPMVYKDGVNAQTMVWNLADKFNVNGSYDLKDGYQLPALYFGKTAGLVSIKDRSTDGSITDTLDLNLIDFTYKFKFDIKGLPRGKKYTMNVVANNASCNYLGRIMGVNANYVSSDLSLDEEGKLSLTVPMLTVNQKTFKSTLTIYQLDADGKPGKIFEASFDKILDRLIQLGGGDVIACSNYNSDPIPVTIDVQKDEGGIFMGMTVTILKWNMVFRTVDL